MSRVDQEIRELEQFERQLPSLLDALRICLNAVHVAHDSIAARKIAAVSQDLPVPLDEILELRNALDYSVEQYWKADKIWISCRQAVARLQGHKEMPATKTGKSDLRFAPPIHYPFRDAEGVACGAQARAQPPTARTSCIRRTPFCMPRKSATYRAPQRRVRVGVHR